MNQCRLHKTKKHGTTSTLSALSLADSRQWGAAPPPRRWCQCPGAAAPWRRRWSGDCRSPAGALRLGAAPRQASARGPSLRSLLKAGPSFQVFGTVTTWAAAPEPAESREPFSLTFQVSRRQRGTQGNGSPFSRRSKGSLSRRQRGSLEVSGAPCLCNKGSPGSRKPPFSMAGGGAAS